MSEVADSCGDIVMGAGSAGAIVAARLSEDPQPTARLLLEAGPEDQSLRSRVPPGLAEIVFDADDTLVDLARKDAP